MRAHQVRFLKPFLMPPAFKSFGGGNILQTFCLPRESGFHPTQKPIEVMQWCLGFLPDAETILDPFMGSGTTLVACAKLGRKGIGIELDPDYFDIAVERVRKAYEQADMFVPAPSKPIETQADLLDDA
jgi:DNA modification methylase